jgi:CheY-like chemotaxis protein
VTHALPWTVRAVTPNPQAASRAQQEAGARAEPVVLIVDDDDAIREVLKLALETDDYSAEVACDGEDALSWLRQHRVPCLILLDLMMPIMNGWELLEQLHQDERLARVPEVLTTAFERDLGTAAALPVLRKPIELGVLLETVHRYCCGTEE